MKHCVSMGYMNKQTGNRQEMDRKKTGNRLLGHESLICKDGIGIGQTSTSYSDNQKTLELEVDIQTQVLTLNSPMKMRHRNCGSVKTLKLI